MKAIFIIGNGFIGNKLTNEFRKVISKDEKYKDYVVVNPLDGSKKRIKTAGDIAELIKKSSESVGADPCVLINAIGKTGRPNVDWCEDNKEETFFSNVEIPVFIAAIAGSYNIPLIHISSGCIFNGPGPFSTFDKPNFEESYYSYTKAEAERRLIKALEYSFSKLDIHRIRMPFTDEEDDRNLITKLLKYDQTVDAPNSITYINEYMDFVIDQVLNGYFFSDRAKQQKWFRVVHAVNSFPIKHSQIIKIIEDVTGKKIEKKYITPEELNKITRAPRTNTVLVPSNEYMAKTSTSHEAIKRAVVKYFKIGKTKKKVTKIKKS